MAVILWKFLTMSLRFNSIVLKKKKKKKNPSRSRLWKLVIYTCAGVGVGRGQWGVYKANFCCGDHHSFVASDTLWVWLWRVCNGGRVYDTVRCACMWMLAAARVDPR